MSFQNKVKFPLWAYPQTLKDVEVHYKNDNCKSQNEFIEKAIKFYIGYLDEEKSVSYISPMITETVKAQIKGTEQRLAHLLFKVAVELGKLSHLTATVDEIFLRLADNNSIKKMYELWCEMEQQKHDIYSLAKIDFSALADNKEFRSVKNMIIQTVVEMDISQETEQTQMQIAIGNTVFSLLVNLSRCIESDYHHRFQSGRKMIDSKLRKMIQQKQQALGQKPEHSQEQTY